MRFGVLVNHEYPKSDDLELRIDELIQMAETARDLGYQSLFGFQHYLGSLATLQPLPVLARLIPHTGDMRVGTAVYLTMENPVQMAENWSTIDRLSGGRLILGLGTGYRQNEFDVFGIDKKTRWPRLFETIELLKALWTGEEVNHRGRFFTVEGEKLSLKPRQEPHPPIWLGASDERRIRQVAEHADSWIVAPNVKFRWAEGHLKYYKEALEEQGADTVDRDYTIIRELSIADTDEEAYAQADASIRHEYYSYAAFGDHWKTMYEDLREKAFLFGSPETVARKLNNYVEAGFTEFIFRFSWAGMSVETSLGSLRRFMEEVAPQFQEAQIAAQRPAESER